MKTIENSIQKQKKLTEEEIIKEIRERYVKDYSLISTEEFALLREHDRQEEHDEMDRMYYKKPH